MIILNIVIPYNFEYFLAPIAPDKDSRQLGIYPPLFGLIGYFPDFFIYFRFHF